MFRSFKQTGTPGITRFERTCSSLEQRAKQGMIDAQPRRRLKRLRLQTEIYQHQVQETPLQIVIEPEPSRESVQNGENNGDLQSIDPTVGTETKDESNHP